MTLRQTPQPGQTYVHQNGYAYEVLVVAQDNYHDEQVVIHKGKHDGRVWSRPLGNFLGLKNGKHRFTLNSNV